MRAGHDYSSGKPPGQAPHTSSEPECRYHEPLQGSKVTEIWGQHSRGDSVEATGLQLQEAVPPVLPGHPEIVDGASKDEELVPLQCEVWVTPSWAFSLKSHGSVLQPKRGQMRPVKPAEGERDRRWGWGRQKGEVGGGRRVQKPSWKRSWSRRLLFSPRKGRERPALPSQANLCWGSCGHASPNTRCPLRFTQGAKPSKINGRGNMHRLVFQHRHGLKREKK